MSEREREKTLCVVCVHDKTLDNLCHLGCGDAKSERERARERESERARERESERARRREGERARQGERERKAGRERGPVGSGERTHRQSFVDTWEREREREPIVVVCGHVKKFV